MYGFGNRKKRPITTTLSCELDGKMRKKGIKASYALAIGAKLLLGEEIARKTEVDKKVEKIAAQLNAISERNWALQERLEKVEQK